MLRDALPRKARNDFLRNGIGLRLIQTTQNARAVKNRAGRGVYPERDLALLAAINQREGKRPALISSKEAIKLYEEAGLTEIVGDMEKNTEYYGNLRGTNDFSTNRLGVVMGCPHPGDEFVKLWAALAGHSVEPAEDENGERLRGMETDSERTGIRSYLA